MPIYDDFDCSEKRKEIASVLRALIDSEKGSDKRGVSLYRLNGMYKQEEGEYIPFRKFDCSTLNDFIHTLQEFKIYMKLINGEDCVFAMANEKTAHIRQMVSQQKRSKKTTSSRGRYNSSYNSRRGYPNSHRYNKAYKGNSPLDQRNATRRPPPKTSTTNFSANSSKQFSQCSKENHSYNNNSNKDFSNSVKQSDSKVEKNFTQKVDTYQFDTSSSGSYYDNYCSKTNGNCFSSNEDLKKSGSYSSTSNFNTNSEHKNFDIVQERTKIRLEQVIQKRPEGIWTSELPRLYFQEYKIELEYKELGFTSVVEFCAALPDIFKIIEPANANKQMIISAKNLLSKQEPVQKKSLSSVYSMDNYIKEEKDAVPIELSTETTERIIPEGMMGLGETVEPFLVTSLDPEIFHEVKISEVFTPSFFWVQLRNNVKKLDILMERLNDYYNTVETHGISIPQGVLKSGLNVACIYEGKWHRAIIKKILYDGYVTVLFYDYGTVKMYHPSKLYYLSKRFSSLPAQAIPCGLLNIIPLNGNEWTQSVNNEFVCKVWNAPLQAKIALIDNENNSMVISLTDVSDDDEDLHIDHWLVENNLARRSKMVLAPNVNNCHRYEEDILAEALQAEKVDLEINECNNFSLKSTLRTNNELKKQISTLGRSIINYTETDHTEDESANGEICKNNKVSKQISRLGSSIIDYTETDHTEDEAAIGEICKNNDVFKTKTYHFLFHMKSKCKEIHVFHRNRTGYIMYDDFLNNFTSMGNIIKKLKEHLKLDYITLSKDDADLFTTMELFDSEKKEIDLIPIKSCIKKLIRWNILPKDQLAKAIQLKKQNKENLNLSEVLEKEFGKTVLYDALMLIFEHGKFIESNKIIN